MDTRANLLMDRKVFGIVFSGMVVVVTLFIIGECSAVWCSL